MPPPLVVTSDEPREFAVDEIFFSTTDGHGVITSGNDVFVRISGYTGDELIGRAHNIVRHPDMPRAAFRLVWERLRAKKTVAALVKNRAKDGRHYWVVSLFAPTPQGFLSVRFKPTGKIRALVEPLYAEMLAAEKSARTEGATPDVAMEAGGRVLAEGLGRLGFPDYDAFMRVLLCEELKSRDATLARERRTILRPVPALVKGDPTLVHLARLYGDGCRAYEHLNQLYHRLDDFVALSETLDRKSAFVNGLTDELRLASMNVALASSRLGFEGQSLGVISRHLGEASGDVATAVDGLVSGIGTLSERLRAVIFNLASARLQIEMVLNFVHELIERPVTAEAQRERRGLIHTLHGAYSATMAQAGEALHELEGRAHGLNGVSQGLERHMLSLQVTQLGGVVESTRLTNRLGFTEIFSHIRGQIDRTRTELADLSDALERLDRLANETPAIVRKIEHTADEMETDLSALVAA